MICDHWPTPSSLPPQDLEPPLRPKVIALFIFTEYDAMCVARNDTGPYSLTGFFRAKTSMACRIDLGAAPRAGSRRLAAPYSLAETPPAGSRVHFTWWQRSELRDQSGSARSLPSTTEDR